MRRLVLVVLLLMGCGEAATGVGSRCTDGNECELRSTSACVVSWPDGYCTEFACTVGSCPDGARCVSGITFPGVPFDAFCLDACAVETDCRDGYRCVDVSLPERVCAPGDT